MAYREFQNKHWHYDKTQIFINQWHVIDLRKILGHCNLEKKPNSIWSTLGEMMKTEGRREANKAPTLLGHMNFITIHLVMETSPFE